MVFASPSSNFCTWSNSRRLSGHSHRDHFILTANLSPLIGTVQKHMPTLTQTAPNPTTEPLCLSRPAALRLQPTDSHGLNITDQSQFAKIDSLFINQNSQWFLHRHRDNLYRIVTNPAHLSGLGHLDHFILTANSSPLIGTVQKPDKIPYYDNNQLFEIVVHPKVYHMRRFLLLLFSVLLLCNGEISGQNIEITVLNKNSQPMPYAYILINNKPVEVTDTLGKAIIPANKLVINDTISVSYLGAYPTKTIYTKDLEQNKKHSFYLDESAYNLNEVVVTYEDIEKLFRKSTKILPVLYYNCKMDANFDAKLSYPNQTGFSLNGTLEAINDIRFKPRYFNWFDPPFKFITNGDTVGKEKSLSFNTHQALFFVNFSLYIWEQNLKNKTKPYYSYLGQKDNYNVFRISYPKTWFVGFYYQIILNVDKDTKYIKSVEIEAFNNEPNVYNRLHRFSLQYDCELYSHKKPKMKTIYLPVNVQYTFQTINTSTFNLKISNISIK
jgi:hypothetical protein